ncbi:MAG TPA: asparagine synthase (glutamine-hydrolyzing) [Blastocatellia bacterium]|nr:asparagine synthase (glutamine-hydrolyzing) [Blastocatellia bacterium]
MCGICGIAAPGSFIRRNVDESLIVRMREALRHRGPDDAGHFIEGAVALGHRRLSIVDLTGGRQPMSSQDGQSWIVYNGEIYNHRSLRPALEARGYRYRTSSDTETIIHLYDAYGRDAVRYLRGMFAFAIWDGRRRRLLLARDRFGVKPLYYTLRDDGAIFFASEIKALLAARAVKPELNYDGLSDYAANHATSGDETLFRGIRRLPPGHTLIWEDGQVQLERYWELSFSKPAHTLSEIEYVAQFSELFREAVELRLMADVPLGMFLSGGIDSSAIAAVMSELVSEPVKTFSVAFAEREANELEYARLVAKEFGTEHHEVVVTPEEFFAALPELIYHEDEPLAHPSSVALYFVSRLAAQHVKVVLTGEGSDELLAGYSRYRTTLWNLACGRFYHRHFPESLRQLVEARLVGRVKNARLRQRLSRTFLSLPPGLTSLYFDNFAVFSRAMQQRLFTPETLERMEERNPYRTAFDRLSESDAETLLDQLLAADLKTYLHELLMKQDQMSMAASIESRVPFLDHKLAEFVAQLPTRMKLRGLTTKYILRAAMRDRLPPAILKRRKMGFPVPVGAWLRGQFSHLADEYITGARARARGIFNPEFVSELVQRHRAGEDHTERLWALVNFEMWQRRFMDGEEMNETQIPERRQAARGGIRV